MDSSAQVDAVERDAAAVGVEEPHEQRGEVVLPAAAGADQRDAPARLEVQVEVTHHAIGPRPASGRSRRRAAGGTAPAGSGLGVGGSAPARAGRRSRRPGAAPPGRAQCGRRRRQSADRVEDSERGQHRRPPARAPSSVARVARPACRTASAAQTQAPPASATRRGAEADRRRWTGPRRQRAAAGRSRPPASRRSAPPRRRAGRARRARSSTTWAASSPRSGQLRRSSPAHDRALQRRHADGRDGQTGAAGRHRPRAGRGDEGRPRPTPTSAATAYGSATRVSRSRAASMSATNRRDQVAGRRSGRARPGPAAPAPRRLRARSREHPQGGVVAGEPLDVAQRAPARARTRGPRRSPPSGAAPAGAARPGDQPGRRRP